MKVHATVVAVLAGLGVATPVIAQPYYYDVPAAVDGLPSRTVMQIVRSRGFDPVGRLLRRENRYVVNAVDGNGRMHRVLVHARTGRIIDVQAAGLEPPRGSQSRLVPRRFDDDEQEYAMRVPPRGVPLADGDDGSFASQRPDRPRLPPLRPRASIPNVPDDASANVGRPAPLPSVASRSEPSDEPAVETGAGMTGRLPPPPSRTATAPIETPPNAPPAAPRRENKRKAAVTPTVPPMPRPRPQTADTAAVEPVAQPQPVPAKPVSPLPQQQATTNDTSAPVANPAKARPLPRVVLPGGPLPKHERTADNKPGVPIANSEPAPDQPAEAAPQGGADTTNSVPSAAPASPALPPVQPLD